MNENEEKWYGGAVVDVANGGKRIRVHYDDGTSEETSFPDKEIIVDDEENGHHQVSADAFIPKQIHENLEMKKESKTSVSSDQHQQNSVHHDSSKADDPEQQTTDKDNGGNKASESMMANDEKNQETEVKKRRNDPIRTTPLETGKIDQEDKNDVVDVSTHEAKYDELLPLPDTPPLPNLSQSSSCEFSFDDSTRVLLAKFKPCPNTGKVTINQSDKTSLLQMMERDDVTVISEGLIDDVDWGALEDLEFLQDLLYSHHICTFSRVETEGAESSIKYVESGEPQSMKVEDYFAYLHKYDYDCNTPSEVLSLKNFNLRKYLPSLTDDLKNNFKFREIMPGEKHCITSAVSISLLYSLYWQFQFIENLQELTV